ncbi:MAG: VWA domain-containing protein [Candidatus Bathyarchaeia archaeon]
MENFFKTAAQKRNPKLELKIANEIPDPYPWGTVTLLRRDLREKPADILKGWLLAEVELRSSYPGTLERLMSWVYLAWERGLRGRRTFVGLFSNALVDKKLLTEEPEIYPKFFRYRLKGLKETAHPLTRLFYEIEKPFLEGEDKIGSKRADELHELLFERPLEPTTRLRLLLDKLPPEAIYRPVDTSQELLVYGSISESMPSFAMSSDEMDGLLRTLLPMGATPNKLKTFWKDSHLCLTSSLEVDENRRRFDEYLKERITYLRKVALRERVLGKAEKAEQIILEFIDYLRRGGLIEGMTSMDRSVYSDYLEDVLESVSGPYIELTDREQRQILKTATKLHFNNVFIITAHELKGFRRQHTPPPMGAWNIGDHIKALSIPDTFRIYGMFIPGVFAMKKWEWWQKREFANVCVIMDVSGSTAVQDKIYNIREAVFCLIEACRYGSDLVTFIPFSTGVNDEWVRMHSKDYETIEDLIISIEPSGYTNITPALQLAARAAERPGAQITYIFTDGGVWDGDNAQGLLDVLVRYGKVYLFLIGDKVEYLHEKAKPLTSGVVVHEVSLYESLVEKALSEYFNK